MSESFQDKYAYYYDLLYKDKDYEQEVDFLEEIFKRFFRKKPNTILDLACGTGGHIIPLAKRGYRVSGLDVSSGMFRRVREKTKKEGIEVNLYKAPMQKFNIKERFDVVISMFSAINYVMTYDGLKSMFGCIRNHLNKGGLYYFDSWNGLAVIEHYDPCRQKTVKGNDIIVERIGKTKIDPIKQLCWVNYHCSVYQDKKKIDDFKESHELKFFFIEEIKNYLADSGFEVLAAGPFLQINKPITEKDWDINFIVRKK